MLMLKVRSTLKEYWEVLQFEYSLAPLPQPFKSVYRAFKEEVYVKGATGLIPFLGGHSSSLYDDIDELVVLCVQDNPDQISKFGQDYCVFLPSKHSRGTY